MKNAIIFSSILCILLSCNNKNHPAKSISAPAIKTYTPPPPGTIVAADSILYAEDPLNHFYFGVKLRVSATANSEISYDILINKGPQKVIGNMAMPRGGRDLQLLLHKDDSTKYGYIIGFIPGAEHGGNNTFQPYYSVTADRENIYIRQIRDYYFE